MRFFYNPIWPQLWVNLMTLHCVSLMYLFIFEDLGGVGDEVPEVSDSEDENQWMEEEDEHEAEERVLCLFCER